MTPLGNDLRPIVIVTRRRMTKSTMMTMTIKVILVVIVVVLIVILLIGPATRADRSGPA